MQYAYPEAWVRLRPTLGDPDPYSGEAELTWDTPAEFPVEGCISWQTTAEEATTVNRETLTTMRTLSVPYGTDVTAADRWRDSDGTVWHGDGRPNPFRSPFTNWTPGTIVPLRLQEG